LTLAQLKEAHAHVLTLKGSLARAAVVSNRTGATLEGGDRQGLPDSVASQVDRLFGASVLDGRDDQVWFEKLLQLLDALDQDEPLTYELSFYDERVLNAGVFGAPPRSRPSEKEVADAFPYMEVMQGGKPIEQRMQLRYRQNNSLKVLKGLRLEDGSLSFGFFEDTGTAKSSAQLDLPGPWRILHALHFPGVREPADEQDAWLVPLQVTDAGGTAHFLWVCTRFSRRMPALKDWLRESDWPEVRQ
jgi:hypothetical protein